MANNFFLNQDPLLYQNVYRSTEDDMRQQLNDSLNQYKILQQQQGVNMGRDYIGELDRFNKSLNQATIDALSDNKEYVELKNDLMNVIQDELLNNIKWKINSNPLVVKNIEKQFEIVKKVNGDIENEQRRNLNELNDYVKNYSDITFDEYKKMKNEKKQ